ncbi:Na+-transporting NADH:ubiquinone oxidoreductase subunit A [Desulfuromusa kysingii]|uniref:Na(+)-translocating NADH-quinone reductase subunit A n=1 Tax=Desulfuromusa kysingii TaxID=37625 RepID=A0A1H4BKV9_9BACT|nr:Na(+)-translocating NADH-quinone reductase subunit A [Desulfuromusa kysingii]SEA48825.1 Na+-transporting NADH:ubiquinone oxidoreductase subunit A [Desulfuromusa kysingii]
MKTFAFKKGLDVPVTGEPRQVVEETRPVDRVALSGDDYIGMKPTMEVAEGERVKTGQLLFVDKKTKGIRYTSPATGTVLSINRGAKRKFESVVIEIEEDDYISFLNPQEKSTENYASGEIRSILQESGVWNAFRTRPFGKVPDLASSPASLFITAMESRPLSPDPDVIIACYKKEFSTGLTILDQMHDQPTYLCLRAGSSVDLQLPPGIEVAQFSGPHPAGLPSTHIHMIDQASETRVVWHLDYQDVIAIGHLFQTGHLLTEKIIALGGPAVKNPRLIKTRIGANIDEICRDELVTTPVRIISGSILDGREVDGYHRYLGRYHHQIAVLHEGSSRGLFSWVSLGGRRFSMLPVFSSALHKARKFAMNTALWGGKRVIFPVDSYDKVMPLDIIPLAILKSIAVGDTEKARNLGALELIEEDLALLSFVCPGKSEFGPMLRRVLTEIELEG